MTASARKRAIAAAFTRAVDSYDAHAGMQRAAAAGLAARIAALTLPSSPAVLEIGCGTGALSAHLADILPGLHAILTDIAPAMLAHCHRHLPSGPFAYAAMDGEHPAFAPSRFDLICSSLALQWFDHPAATLRRWHRLLRPAGWVALATLGPGSLAEWRAALRAEGLDPPTPAFCPPELIARAWPGPARIDTAWLAVAHPSGRAFLASLRALGAATPRPGHTPMTAAALTRALARFERASQCIARYEIITACLSA